MNLEKKNIKHETVKHLITNIVRGLKIWNRNRKSSNHHRNSIRFYYCNEEFMLSGAGQILSKPFIRGKSNPNCIGPDLELISSI